LQSYFFLFSFQRTEPDQPSSPTSQVSPTNKRKKAAIGIRRKSQKADILKFDAGEFAQQLALIANRLYNDIRATEILAWARCEDPDHPDVQNLMKLCHFSGKLVKLVKYSILTTDTLSRRREMVNHFIKIDEASSLLLLTSSVGRYINNNYP
jgi:son of sevenless